jgi:hypothetical protein
LAAGIPIAEGWHIVEGSPLAPIGPTTRPATINAMIIEILEGYKSRFDYFRPIKVKGRPNE